MSRPRRASWSPRPGTNRDRDVARALDLAGAEPRIALLGRAGRATAAARRGAHRSWSPAASATPTRSAPGGCSPSTSTVGLGDGLRGVRRRRPPGDRHLQRLPGAHPHRPAARRARPQRRAAASTAAGSSSPPSASSALHLDRAASTTRSTARSPTARVATCTPIPTALAAAGQVALRYRGGNPNGSVADIAGVCDATGVGARPDAAPREPRARPPAPAAPPRPDAPRAPSGCGLFEQRRCATSRSDDARSLDRSPTSTCRSPDRRDGKVRVSYALRRRAQRLFVTTDRLSAFDRIIAGVPYKGQVLNQLAAWWFDTHRRRRRQPRRRPCPIPTCSSPAPRSRCRSRSSCAATSPASRRTSLWKRYADGRAHDLRLPLPDGLQQEHRAADTPIVTPTTKAEHGGHDEPLTCAEVVERGPRRRRTCGSSVQAAALGAVRPRPASSARGAGLILADTKYEFGLDRRRRAAADRRGAHARLVALLGGRHATRSDWRAGEEPESLDKEVVRRALADAGYRGDGDPPGAAPRRLGGTSTPLHRRVRTTHRAAVRARQLPGRRPRSRRLRSGDCRLTGHAHEPSPIARSVADDAPHEECGVLGISTPHGEGVAQLAFFGLFALQHRGQEAAGIAVSDGSRARMHKDAGPRRQRVHPDDAGAARRLPRHRPHPLLAPPAPTPSATSSRSWSRRCTARSPSPTTATSSTPRRCATSC